MVQTCKFLGLYCTPSYFFPRRIYRIIIFSRFVYIFQITDCVISYISAYAFEELEYLDYFGIERGSLTLMSAYGMMGLSVEKLTSDTHTIPQNLGMFEILYSALPGNTVPAGFLANFKNLTSVTLRVSTCIRSVRILAFP